MFTRRPRHWLLFAFLAAVLGLAHAGAAEAPVPKGAVWVLTIDGAIGPATSDYVVRSLDDARLAGAGLVVIAMDTPGGLDGAMRSIITAILASEVPVATYVTPKGARAASAGTYILYASHIAAMNEATNLGAATPVQIGVPAMPTPPAAGDAEPEPDTGPTAMERKIVNDASAYIRGLADLRGRNAEWAEEAVRAGVSLSASEALAANVTDYIALDLPDLLAQLQGQSIEVDGRTVILDFTDAPVIDVTPDWRTELLKTLTNPNMLLILGMFGVYGILFELYNPGSLVPGIVGVICLVLAGYALQLLPVNYAGLGLMLAGLVMMVAEAFAPSFGALGIGGIVAFMIGGVMLFDTDIPAFQLGMPALAATAVVSAIVIAATVAIALRMRGRKAATGIETIVGQRGEALSTLDPHGQVRIAGEIWKARAATDIVDGTPIIVTSVNGMVLTVEAYEGETA